MAKEKLISYVKKYKYVALVVLVGVVLMLLPSGKGEQQDTVEPVNVSEGYSLAETERPYSWRGTGAGDADTEKRFLFTAGGKPQRQPARHGGAAGAGCGDAEPGQRL